MVTVVQFRENLTDRQAAEAVRSRIDVKYLLGLELTDSGFDFSVLSEFRTGAIHQALINKGLPPGEHLVDSAYVNADLLFKSLEEQGIIMVGPTRKNPAWQARTEGAYDHYQFDIDWKNERIRCPQGKVSKS